MIAFTKSYRCILLVFFLLFYQVTALFGQENLKYEGPLKIGNYKGQAAYSYKLVANDTVLDGNFELRRSSLSALIANEDASFLLKGAFKNNYPSGPWKFQFGEFQSNSSSEVVDYQYRVMVSGIQETAAGRFQKGRPDGRWVYEVDQIEDSEVRDTLFKSSIEFKNGIPLRSFRIKNEKSTLVGRVLRDGLAHDEWALFSTDEIGNDESWFFKNGLLQKIQFQEDGETKVVPVYGDAIKETDIIRLDQRYLAILQLQQNANDSSIFEKGIFRLLAENDSYYQKIDTILSHLGEANFRTEFSVKVPFHPLDSTETAHMASVKKLFKRAKTVSDSLLNDTQLNILKLSDKDALFLYDVLDVISKKFLYPLGNMVTYEEQEILGYVAREKLREGVWPYGFPSKEISSTNGDNRQKKFIGPNASNFNFSSDVISAAHQIATYTALSVDSIQSVLKPKLAKVKRQQEFIALEERMIAQIKDLNHLIDSVSTKFPSELIAALEHIKTVANTNLSTYSNMTKLDEKLEFGRGLITCFEHLGQLEKSIIDLPERKEEIKTGYQDEIWNPFMANLMTEDVKKRITAAYRKVVLPHLLNEVTHRLNCDNAETLVLLFESTHQRILELRDEDTKKLERKLKRARDPQVVMQLFKIAPLGKIEE